jgi:hypothetical protein
MVAVARLGLGVDQRRKRAVAGDDALGWGAPPAPTSAGRTASAASAALSRKGNHPIA